MTEIFKILVAALSLACGSEEVREAFQKEALF